MLQQVAIPRTPEEVAASINRLTEKERYWLDGVIVGLTTARKRDQERAQTANPQQTEAERSSA